MGRIKLGLFGAGHLGKIHLKCLKNTDFEVVGVYDPDPAVQEKIKNEFDIPVFSTMESLVDAVDAVDIVSTTPTHFKIAMFAVENGKHAFIEKPVTSTLEEARKLMEATQKKGVKVQVGHVERYNPAIVSLKDRKVSPKFIEGHRLATFNPRGNDVSVILDLMIHDLDLVLELVKSDIANVQANGVCVVNDTPDICNARLTFKNGCVANLTASRISMKQMRKLRLFQENEYISIDFLNKESQIIKLDPVDGDGAFDGMTIETSTGKKIFSIESPAIKENNAIEDELNDFHRSILHDTPTTVGIKDGLKALELAYRITEKIEGQMQV